MEDRVKNATRNLYSGLLAKIIANVMPFVVRTVMIYQMGIQYVGLGSLFSTIVLMLSFAELGIGTAIVFSMYEPFATGDNKKICALLSYYRSIYKKIGVVILVIGIAIFPFLGHLVSGEVPSDINLQYLFLIYLVNNVIGYFLFSYKQSLFVASQRVDCINYISALCQLVTGILQIVVLVRFANFYLYAVCIPILTIVNNLILSVLTNHFYPQYKPKGVLSVEEKQIIHKKMYGMVFQKIGVMVLSSVDSIIISSFLGLTALGLYQNYYSIITAGFSVMSMVMSSIVPIVGNCVVLEGIEQNHHNFTKLNLAYVWLVSFCTIALLCLFQPFIELWIGTDGLLSFNLVILFAVYFFTYKWCDMLNVYQEATGLWWETRFVPLTAAVINLITNIILVQIIGFAGVLISTIVAVVFIYGLGYAHILFSSYFKSKAKLLAFWKRQAYYLIVTIIACGGSYAVCSRISIQSLLITLLVRLIIVVIIPNAIFLLAYFRLDDFEFVRELIIKLFRKIRRCR